MAGPPGAGKSTVAREVVHRLNSLWSEMTIEKGSSGRNVELEVATVLPMDGFHLYRSQLDQMEVGFTVCVNFLFWQKNGSWDTAVLSSYLYKFPLNNL